jgi:hypothetical protein
MFSLIAAIRSAKLVLVLVLVLDDDADAEVALAVAPVAVGVFAANGPDVILFAAVSGVKPA